MMIRRFAGQVLALATLVAGLAVAGPAQAFCVDYDCGVDPPIEDQVVEIVGTPILHDPGYLVVDSAYREFVTQGDPEGPVAMGSALRCSTSSGPRTAPRRSSRRRPRPSMG